MALAILSILPDYSYAIEQEQASQALLRRQYEVLAETKISR